MFDQTKEIRAAQVRLLYEQLSPALFATIINASILVAVLWREISSLVLLGWLLVVLVVALVRHSQRRAYLRTRSEDQNALDWGRRFLYGVAVNALLWGFAGFFFFTPDSYVHQVFLAFVLVGMASGSISTLSSSRGAFLVFLILALLPYGVRLVSVNEALHMAMAAMLLVYLAMMGMIAYRLYATVTESLRLRFDKVELLQDLTQAKDRQDIANRELAAQVAQTHSAQNLLREAYAELERRVEERTQELRKSEEALRNTDRRKDEFLAMLGHELRNPLAPIRNALAVMQKPGASDASVNWAREVIDRQIERLTRLVDDLLDVTRIMYRKISLQETMLEIATVVRQAVEGSLPLIESRNQNLAVRVPKEPLWIKGDLVRLDQIISNLLNNAAKYSDVGAQIGLDVDASEQWVTVRVQDNGIGIAPEILPHIFDLFAQANPSLARAQGGLGIGLTVVKRLVEMHGGRVEVHSKGLGHGAEFVVHLPRQPAPVQTENCEPPQDRVIGAGEARRVLVVDDNCDAAETLALLLSLEGYTVAVAHDGPTALSEAARFQPQIVLLDVGMPGMDGYQVVRELRTRQATQSALIVAITGYGQPEDRERAKAAGFDDHLTKPVRPDLLNQVLHAYAIGKQ